MSAISLRHLVIFCLCVNFAEISNAEECQTVPLTTLTTTGNGLSLGRQLEIFGFEAEPKECKFPFTYNGRTYEKCMVWSSNKNPFPVCATMVDANGNRVKTGSGGRSFGENLGVCDSSCQTDEPSARSEDLTLSDDRQAAEVAAAAVGPLFDTLNGLNESFYENGDVVCYWNKWKDRDQRAKIMKTYKHGRFSHTKRFWGVANGKWYCAYKPGALKKLGWSLDRGLLRFIKLHK